MSMVFANRSKNHAEDEAIFNTDRNCWVGRYGGKTLEELKAGDPDMELIHWDEFTDLVEARMTTDPVEISESDYWYLLEVLPPCSWHRAHDSESFFMSEFTSGRVTCHVVRIGKRYFKFEAPVMTAHADRTAKVWAWLDKQEAV